MYIAISPGLLLLKSNGKPRPSYSNTTKKIEKSLITFFAGFYHYLLILLLYLFFGGRPSIPRSTRVAAVAPAKEIVPTHPLRNQWPFEFLPIVGETSESKQNLAIQAANFVRNLGGK